MNPNVHIGQHGLTEGVFTKVSQELEHHELIKVKVGQGCWDAPKELAPELAEKTEAELVQVIGRVVILFKKRAKDSEIELPKP